MTAAPFGLAYGIGAGLTQIPQGINEAKDRALTTKMRNLQLAEMERNMQDEANVRSVMSQPGLENTETQVQSPDTEMPLAESAPGVAAQAYRTSTAPDGTQSAPDTSIPQTMTQPGATRTIKAFSTPQQQQAATFRQKAQSLYKLGAYRSAMALEQQANTLDDQHSKLARIGLQRAIATGDEDSAINYLHGLGAVNAVDIKKLPNGGISIVSQAQGGSPTSVDLNQQEYEGLISGQDPAVIWANAQNRQLRAQAIQQKGEHFEKSMELKKQHEENMDDYRNALLANQSDRNKIMAENARFKAQSGGATWQLILKRRDNMLAVAAQNGENLDPEVALAAAIKQQDTSKRATVDPSISIARERVKAIETANHGRQPKPGSPQYDEWKMAHDIVMGGLAGSVPSPSKPKPAQTSLGAPVAKDRAGKLVYNSNGKYVYADGTEYVAQ